MAEYIEREEAIEAVIDAADEWDGGYNPHRAANIRDGINSIPAADVRPVVRGTWGNRWICSNMCGYEYACSCSVCGKPTYRMSLMERMPNFCPNCGADMREES